MSIWIHWWIVINELRPACSRTRSFMWLAASLAGICIRSDLAGVSSIVRALGLRAEYYDRLLDFFHSHAIDVDQLARLWTRLVFRFFPAIARVNDRVVLLADGIKIPKAGRKMPGIKLLHQESDSNTKPEYIMGHSCQAVSVVVNAGSSAFAVPLAVRIHEGLIFSNRCRRKLTDKMVSLIQMTGIALPFYLVADAYYACKAVALPLIEGGDHLVTRIRNNAVAHSMANAGDKMKPGRPRFYGKKTKLKTEEAARLIEERNTHLKIQLKETENKLNRLLDLHLEGTITSEEYRPQKEQLLKQKLDLAAKLDQSARRADWWLEPAMDFLQTALRAGELAESKNLEAQKDFLKTAGLNLQISGRRLLFTPVEPWKTLADARDLFKGYVDLPTRPDASPANLPENADRRTRGRAAFSDRPSVEERKKQEMRKR